MPKYKVKSPETGKTYIIVAPEGSTPADLKARVRRHEKTVGYNTGDLLRARFMQEITLNGWDEIAGFTEAVTKEAVELFGGKESDFKQAYEEAKAQQLAGAKMASEVSPAGALSADIASLLFGGGTLAKGVAAVAKPGIRELSRQMAVTGAGLGALGGFLGGEGEGRLAGALGGGTIGALLGGLTPAAFLGTARGAQWANRFFRGDKDAGLRYLEEVLKAEQITPGEIAQQMQRAQDLGVPLRPADVRSGLRGALGAATRAPSAARNQALEEIRARQADITDRLTDAISRHLGPITNLRKQETALVEKARASAKPLYEAAYAKPGVWNERLQSILDTPAGKRALARARTIAANEKRDPTKLGFDIAEGTNEVILTRQPSMQTLDYVKRGFDDELNAMREPVTNKLRLDEGGRAILNLQKEFVDELDRLNPDYAKARAAWGGEISKKNAMLDGQGAINYTADELEYILSLKQPVEQEFFKLGYRKAIADRLESKGDFANTARDLLGTRQKRKALQTVFGKDANFDDFTETVKQEDLTVATFNELTGNSKTAERLFETLNYADALSGVPGGAASLLRSDPGGLLQASLARMTKQAQRRTQSAADQTLMQTLLAENPQTALQELSRIDTMNAQQAAQRQRQAGLAAGVTAPTTAIGGVLTGIGVSEVPEERQPLQSELLAESAQIDAIRALLFDTDPNYRAIAGTSQDPYVARQIQIKSILQSQP